jgi:inositol hexakisphosphate/diphosphoinositol-pentakisphosphate kinase
VCGFDLLRCGNGTKAQVIDVNGWSFVKGNESYYGRHSPFDTACTDSRHGADKTAEILAGVCMRVSSNVDRPLLAPDSTAPETSNWMLKANVTVFRHADRTPKQKLKFNFPIGEAWTAPFIVLLNGERDEIILREKEQLQLIAAAVDEAKTLGANGENLNKLSLLSSALIRKIDLPGTKAQLKPVYSKKVEGQERSLTKLTLVFKWGGEVLQR